MAKFALLALLAVGCGNDTTSDAAMPGTDSGVDEVDSGATDAGIPPFDASPDFDTGMPGCDCDVDATCTPMCDCDPECAASGLCSDECGPGGSYVADGECDDGGPGSNTSLCALGTDCTDCGPREGGCDCDLSSGCDEGCDCDDDCAGCTCDATTACDPGCACDPECAGCSCDTDSACQEGCDCDDDCGGGCPCDTGAGCQPVCGCDEDCGVQIGRRCDLCDEIFSAVGSCFQTGAAVVSVCGGATSGTFEDIPYCRRGTETSAGYCTIRCGSCPSGYSCRETGSGVTGCLQD
ncbi:MAG: hypothetical protein AAGE52_25710 [Myxococcota bacterium]